MGATLRSFAVRDAPGDEVRQLALRWLAAKGFLPSDGPVLFPLDEQHERGLVLAYSDRWTALVFSHAFQEGDRLLFELNKLGVPLLQVWVYDSDIWGYRLHVDGELAVSFNSHPTYFGRPADLELPKNGDPYRLCRVLGVEELTTTIAKIQRRWSVFSERVASHFCDSLSVGPLVLHYSDFEDVALRWGSEPIEAAGFRFERVLLRRGPMPTGPELHNVPIDVKRVSEVDPEFQQWQEQMTRQLWPVIFLVRYVLSPLMRVVVIPLTAYFRIRAWLSRGAGEEDGGLFQELYARRANDVQLDGPTLTNVRHGCQITLPEGVETIENVGFPTVFQFRLLGHVVWCRAIRPNQLRETLRCPAGWTVRDDVKRYAGSLQTRVVIQQSGDANSPRQFVTYLVQATQATYQFQLNVTQDEVPQNIHQSMEQVLDSFRLLR